MKVIARAPGRVNLVGDHTDYTGGFVFPVAIDRWTEIEFERGVPWIELVSAEEEDPAILLFDDPVDPSQVQPVWARYLAGVAAVVQPPSGGRGFIRTTIPIGAGLASSAALEVAAALALGFRGTPLALALACQQAEHIASGVPCGIMDQLTCTSAVSGHALLIDCRSLAVDAVPLPDGLDIFVVDSGERRSLTTSFYGVRRAQCEEAEQLIGPLRDVSLPDLDGVPDDVLRRRARHVVSENARVLDFAAALGVGDLAAAGRLMTDSHASLRDDFEVSTTVLDGLVEAAIAEPGVLGARLTGAGFGGCIVVLAERGASVELGAATWQVRPAGAATIEVIEE